MLNGRPRQRFPAHAIQLFLNLRLGQLDGLVRQLPFQFGARLVEFLLHLQVDLRLDALALGTGFFDEPGRFDPGFLPCFITQSRQIGLQVFDPAFLPRQFGFRRAGRFPGGFKLRTGAFRGAAQHVGQRLFREVNQ